MDSPPTLFALFVSFMRIGLSGFGGGLAAWTRLEIVQRRRWLDDPQFLSGYALSQLIPGATNVNLAVFIGTLMRGRLGALAGFAGLTFVPVTIVLAVGVLYFRGGSHAVGAWMGAGLAGMGAVAIGMNLGTGLRLALANIRGAIPIALTAVIALSIGIFGIPLVDVLLVMIPLSLLAAWLTR